MHNLTLTPEGNLELRRLTAQWLASAPAPDATWEYYASRQASGLLGLELGGRRFAPEEFRIAYTFDDSREKFDIVLFHPQFKQSDENVVRQALFLTMDECLGEDDVERWIGSLDAARSAPPGAVPLADFPSIVADARAKATGDRWTLSQGESRDGRPVLLAVNTALKQIDHLDHVFYFGVAIGLRQPDANGFPAKTESDHLNVAEDRLLAKMGDDIVEIGRVTWGGRRELHFFITDPASTEAAFAAWAAEIAPWSASRTIAFDPQWSAARSGIYAALAPRR